MSNGSARRGAVVTTDSLQGELERLKQHARRNQLYLAVALTVVGFGSIIAVGLLGYLGRQFADQLWQVQQQLRASEEELIAVKGDVRTAMNRQQQQLEALSAIHEANTELRDELVQQRVNLVKLRERSEAIHAATEHAIDNLRQQEMVEEVPLKSAGSAALAANAPRKFTHGTTSYLAPEGEGEEVTELKGFLPPTVPVRRVMTPNELPAHLHLEVTPDQPGLGDDYQLRVLLVNRTNAELGLHSLRLNWSFDGKKTGGPLAPKVDRVDARASAVLYELEGQWLPPQDHGDVNLTATVTLNDGARLTNSLHW